jgi:acyl-CoA thioester hydrolase
MLPFVHRERVRFGDLDAMRHLNNVVFLRYFENARISYLRQLMPAYDPSSPEKDPFGVIFAQCHIDYRAPVHFDEDLDVMCGISDVGRKSFRVPFEMRVGDRLAADGFGVLVAYDYASGRSRPLPDALRARLESAAA